MDSHARGALGESPRVTVLMATYNGRTWIDEQIDSILDQRGVDVTLLVSDDGSTDGTVEHVAQRAGQDRRIRLLPPRDGTPGVTGNFLHLFMTHRPDGSYVAFTDQDDVWHLDKLSRQIAILEAEHADVTSSNVTSFDQSGKKTLIDKAGAMQRWDHIFEAAGPGSTYVFTPEFHEKLRDALELLDYSAIGVHDWYVYAISRAIGAKWIVSATPTLDYRQHEANVQGANRGLGAYTDRFARLRSGFYRGQFLAVACAVRQVATYDDQVMEDLSTLIGELEDTSVSGRLKFARRWRQIRRKPREGFQLALAHVLGVW